MIIAHIQLNCSIFKMLQLSNVIIHILTPFPTRYETLVMLCNVLGPVGIRIVPYDLLECRVSKWVCWIIFSLDMCVDICDSFNLFNYWVLPFCRCCRILCSFWNMECIYCRHFMFYKCIFGWKSECDYCLHASSDIFSSRRVGNLFNFIQDFKPSTYFG